MSEEETEDYNGGEEAEGEEKGAEVLMSGEQGEGEHEAKIPENPLKQEYIPECLSLLCKIGSGLEHAYVRFDGRERDFTAIDHLSTYPHIRYLDLTGNLLTDISPCNCMQELLVLKVGKNNLTSTALNTLTYLQDADFSSNKIETLESLDHPMLEKLNLNSNHIERVSGLNPEVLINLTTLELRGNKLQSLEGIVELRSLKNLYLAANKIKDLNGIENLQNLQKLHVRDNQISDLNGFSAKNKKLNYINFRGNEITSLDEISKLRVLLQLKACVLTENPMVEENENFRVEVLILLRRLERCDKDPFAEEERAEAEDLYEARKNEEPR